MFGSSGMADPFFRIFSISGITPCERLPDIDVNIKGNKIGFLFKVCIWDSVSFNNDHGTVTPATTIIALKKALRLIRTARRGKPSNAGMNELNISEMEQVNGGLCSIAVAACVVGVVSAAIKVADFVYDTVKGK